MCGILIVRLAPGRALVTCGNRALLLSPKQVNHTSHSVSLQIHYICVCPYAMLNSLGPGRCDNGFKSLMFELILWIYNFGHTYKIAAVISQHWFRKWFGVVRHQAITWTNVYPNIRRPVVTLGHNELNYIYADSIALCVEMERVEVTLTSDMLRNNQMKAVINAFWLTLH